ncbi:MAG: bifunctional demethylmenaquinone methyltransferase/2-methoxy-6-polyprenyl-1,4-benzoquinol methylase UbiE [Bacteroidota bacterium]
MNKDTTQQGGKKEKVRNMFDSIAGHYDFLNHFLSFGIDKLWRHRVLKYASQQKPQKILDVATGTADLAITLSKCQPQQIVGVDISEEMLKIGREKITKKGLSGLITLKSGDSEALPFSDRSFDLVTAAFGVRNFEDLDKGLREMNRVLKPGAKLMILEFSKVSGFPWKILFNFYFKFILPTLGRLISKHDFAYSYLPESVNAFPSGENFLEHLKAAGFAETRQERLNGGIASIYFGEKK